MENPKAQAVESRETDMEGIMSKGKIGCDGGGDTREMIRRCLSCKRPTCIGTTDCARGYPIPAPKKIQILRGDEAS